MSPSVTPRVVQPFQYYIVYAIPVLIPERLSRCVEIARSRLEGYAMSGANPNPNPNPPQGADGSPAAAAASETMTDDEAAEAWMTDYNSWRQSVEDRFTQVGQALQSAGSGGPRRRTNGHIKSGQAQPSVPEAPGTSAGNANQPSGDGATGAGNVPTAPGGASGGGDSRRPNSSHFWWRRFGE